MNGADQPKTLYLVCCVLPFFGARNPEVHYYFQRDGTIPVTSFSNNNSYLLVVTCNTTVDSV